MKRTEEAINALLNENIPVDAVSERDSGFGKSLSYLETWYVIDRLNSIFGALNWSKETLTMEQIQGVDKVSYKASVRVTVITPSGATSYRDGYGYGSDKYKANPHELAVKEAESDAFKRAAMQFGRSLGLALYDKTRQFIDEADRTGSTIENYVSAENKPALAKKTASGVITPQPTDSKGNPDGISIAGARPKNSDPTPTEVAPHAALKAKARELDTLKKLTIADFRDKHLKPHKAVRVDDLTAKSAQDVLTALNQEFKQ